MTQNISAPAVSTTQSGAPVTSDAHSQSVGADGAIILTDHYLIEKLTEKGTRFRIAQEWASSRPHKRRRRRKRRAQPSPDPAPKPQATRALTGVGEGTGVCAIARA